MPRPRSKFRGRSLCCGAIAVVGLSLLTCFFGAAALLRFETTPGAAGQTPMLWPSASSLVRAPGRFHLLLFAHPLCSCTAATLSELAQVEAQLLPGKPQPAVTILFFRPSKSSEWKSTSSWTQAVHVAHSTVLWDDAGKEAKLFGAETSGFILLYNGKGELLFHGGITGSRGHEGDNYGLDRLVSAISTGRPALLQPVFGCGLWGGGART